MRFLFFVVFMRKLAISLSAIFTVFIWFSFAAPTVLNHSYTVDWNDIKIFWTDNSEWWYVDINVQDPSTNDWLHFGTAKISDQVFTYTKQWDWDQKIWLIPGDGWDEIRFTVPSSSNSTATRTVIPAVPKTGPSIGLVWIILATLAIFGGYIYIKKRADI